MGPKAKKKDKNAKSQIPSIDPNEIVTELDKEFFEFQLSEIEKKIQRIEAKEEEMKTGTLEIEHKIEEFKKEKGYLIDEQEQMLALKKEEKMRKHEESAQLAEKLKTCEENHIKHVQEVENKYIKMVEKLSAELAKLEEEVRILEDFKANVSADAQGLLNLEKEMDESEMQHQRNLFYIEQKSEVVKQRIKKELQSKLLQLSIEFQQTTKKRIGKPSHRMTQESKAIENELRLMKDDVIEYQELYAKAKANVKLCKEQHLRWLAEKDKGIAKLVIQMAVIKSLLKEREELATKQKEYFPFEVHNKSLGRKLRALTRDNEVLLEDIDEVNTKIKEIVAETEGMSQATAHLKRSMRRLNVHVRNAIKIAEEAKSVQLIPMGVLEEERYITLDSRLRLFRKRRDSTFRRKGKILNYLMEFLMLGKLTEDDKKFLRSSASFDIDALSFTQIFRKVGEKDEGSKASIGESEDEGGPYVGERSELSLPRSETPEMSMAKAPSESLEGEFEEEFGEGDDALEAPPAPEPLEVTEIIEEVEDGEEDEGEDE